MSDAVPCRQPYEPRLPRDESDTVILHVGRGSEMDHITGSVELLCRGSDYFYDRYMSFVICAICTDTT